MGGSIPIAARFNDGQAICVDGWTNFIPAMVMNDTTLSGDDAVVRETLLEVAGHANYEGPQPFRAYGYGMIVIDFVGREIHSMQSYTSFERKGLNQLLNINECGWRDGVYVNALSKESEGLLDAGRVRKTGVNLEPCDPVVLTRETAIAMLDASTRAFLTAEPPTFVDLLLDTAPFAVTDYPDGGSLTAMKVRLRAAGFPITKAAGLNRMLAGAANADRKGIVR